MKRHFLVVLTAVFSIASSQLFAFDFNRNVDFVDASVAGDYSYMKTEMQKGMSIDTPRGGRGYETALMKAVKLQNIEMLSFCLKYRANVNKRNPEGITPLMMASETGNIRIADLLIKHGAKLNMTDNPGKGVLSYAAKNDDMAMIKFLLKKGARKSINHALLIASGQPDASMVKLLIRYGGSVNYPGREGDSPLLRAVRTGDILTVGVIIDKNKKLVNLPLASIGSGITPLGEAAMNGDIKMMKYLISRGASLRYRNREGESLIFTAMRRNKPNAALYLLEKGVSVKLSNRRGETPLQFACGHIAQVDPVIVKGLIKKGADIKKANRYGITPLMLAAGKGRLGTVKILVEKGAKINRKTSNGFTAMTYAARSNHAEIEKYLISKGGKAVKVRYRARRRSPAKRISDVETLRQAVSNRNISVIGQVLSRGINVSVKDWRGKTPLEYATLEGDLRVVSFLLKKGAASDSRSLNMSLVNAAGRDIRIVKLLLLKGADIHYDNGRALLNAINWCRYDIIDFLLSEKIITKKMLDSKRSPLRSSKTAGDYLTLKLLHKHGISFKGKNGDELVVRAVKRKRFYMPAKIIEFLIANGADRNSKTFSGETALDLANKFRNRKLAAFLEKKGFRKGKVLYKRKKKDDLAAKKRDIKNLMEASQKGDIKKIRAMLKGGISIHSSDVRGNTVLHTAALYNQYKIIPELLKLGSNIRMRNKYGYTARQLAKRKKYYRVVNVLDEYESHNSKRNSYQKKKSFSTRIIQPPDKNRLNSKKTALYDDKTVFKTGGLVLYGNPSCGRCIGFRRKLDREKIRYSFKNVYKDSEANKRMWYVLRHNGFRDRRVKYPVLQYNEKVAWPDRKKHFTAKGVFWVDKYYREYLKITRK